jgi:hypothetical protein
VEGRVHGIHCSPTSCLLAFDPTFNRFTATVQAQSFKTFPPEALNAQYVGRRVHVTGKIQMLARKPEIVVSNPEDLVVIVTKQEKEQEQQSVRDETAARIDEILDRIEALTDRVAAAQERLEQLALVIDQRASQLEQLALALQTPPDPAPQPSYGQPQPRPGYEQLLSIKRGMSSAEVARLVGRPLETDRGSSGGFTWYYGYGRSVTFNSRGNVASLTGFPGQ